MFDVGSLFVSVAFAQDAVADMPEETTASLFMSYLPFILIFGVFYILVIRPQQKRLADQDSMLKALKKGDRVVASGGIHGTVSKIDEEKKVIFLDIAKDVQIMIDRDSVTSLEFEPKEDDDSETSEGNGKKK